MAAPRILHIFPGFAVGGAQVRTARLVDGLGDAFEHALVSLDGDRAGYGLLAAPQRLEWLEPPPRAGSFRTARALAAIVRAVRPDVIATYNWGAIDGVIGARLAGRRAVVHHEDGFGPAETRRRLLRRNLWRFLKSEIHYFSGMRNLITEFYRSIQTGGPLPIEHAEILRVTRVMDEIFADCRLREADACEPVGLLQEVAP